MSSNRRLAKINKHLQRTVGEVLLKEAELPVGTLVTVSYVDTTPNLRSATVWLSVYPVEASDRVLADLTAQLYHLQGAVNRLLDVKPLPRLLLRIDYGAQHADHIQRTLKNLADEESSSAAQ